MPAARSAPQHPQERKRLTGLERSGFLTERRDPRLDSLVEATARALGVQACGISLLGRHTELVRACFGLPLSEVPRDRSAAAWVVAEGPLVVADAQLDDRCAGLVERADVRAYAGVPLLHAGLPLGVLFVASSEPRQLLPQDLALLQGMADVVVALLGVAPQAERAESPTARKLRLAVAAGQVEPVFSPIVRLADGGLHAVEALVAWRDDSTQLPSASQYLSLTDQAELSVAVHRELLGQAAERVHAWRTAYPAALDLRLSVNVSVRHLEQGDLVDVVRACLARSELDPAALTLEITETSLLRADERAVRSLLALRAEGVGIALDDFGAGCSSLSHLQRFPITQLKIGADFVAGLGGDGPEPAVVEAVLGLATRLGFDVVAEGVDDEEQLRILRELGCGYGQGARFSGVRRASAMDDYLLGTSETASLDVWAEVLRRRRSAGS